MKQLSLLLFIIATVFGCHNKPAVAQQSATENALPDPYAEKRELMNKVNEAGVVPNGILLRPDSSSVNINEFNGKLLIIDFWATWCSPCIKEAPYFQQLREKYQDDNVEFIAISVDDTFPYWQEFLEEKNWKGNHYWIGSHEKDPFFALTYFESKMDSLNVVTSLLPKYVFISPDGKILHNHYSPKPSSPEFAEKINEYLN